ncbi:MAG: cupin domain-containing protein [Kofleriaceae bacterium]
MERHAGSDLVEQLGLVRHPQGGFFRQTHETAWSVETADRADGRRPGLNMIFYLLTRESPIGHFHKDRSDIVHYFHLGSPLTYLTISPAGELSTTILGPDLARGHVLQLVVPGGTWKATVLDGDFGLLSEVVAPAYDPRDMEIATAERLTRLFPHLTDRVLPYVARC